MVNQYGTFTNPNETPAPATRAEADARNTVGRDNRSRYNLDGYGGQSSAYLDYVNESQREVAAQEQYQRERVAQERSIVASQQDYASGQAAYTRKLSGDGSTKVGDAYIMAQEAARTGNVLDPYVARRAAEQGFDFSRNNVTVQSEEGSRSTVPTRDYSSRMDEALNAVNAQARTVYVQYGEQNQIRVGNVAAMRYDEAGQVGFYQKLYDPNTGKERTRTNLVSSGGRNALQSGGFTIDSPETPYVVEQWGVGNYTPVVDKNKSRLGSEAYGGYVQPLDNRTIEDSGASLSRYSNPLNLANLVIPTDVNKSKQELPNERLPWGSEVSVGSPFVGKYVDGKFVETDMMGNRIVSTTPSVNSTRITEQKPSYGELKKDWNPFVASAAEPIGYIGEGASMGAGVQTPQGNTKMQSPIGGLLGLYFFGDKKDDVIRGAAGQTIDVITGLVGWTPVADRGREYDPKLSEFRNKYSTVSENQTKDSAKFNTSKSNYEINSTRLLSDVSDYTVAIDDYQRKSDAYNATPTQEGYTTLVKEGVVLNERRKKLEDKSKNLDAEYASLEKMGSGINTESDALFKNAEDGGVLIRQRGKLVENPDLTYDYGEFTKWNIGAGKTLMGATGINRQSIDTLQTIAESKKGIQYMPERLTAGAIETVFTRPGNVIPYATAGAAMFLGGELIGGAAAASPTLQGISQAHPVLSRVGGGVLKFGVPTAVAGVTYYSASEKFTATPERTEINIGKTIPDFAYMGLGGAGMYAADRSRLPIGFRNEVVDVYKGGKKPFGQNIGDHTVLPGKTPIEAKWSSPVISTTRKPTMILTDISPERLSFLGSEPIAQGIPRRMQPDYTPIDFNKQSTPRSIDATDIKLIDQKATSPPPSWKDVRTSGVPIPAARPVFGEIDTPVVLKPATFYRDAEVHFGGGGTPRDISVKGGSGQSLIMKNAEPLHATEPLSLYEGNILEMGSPKVESTTMIELEGARGTGMQKQPTLTQRLVARTGRTNIDNVGVKAFAPTGITPYELIKSEAKPISPATVDNNVAYKSEKWKQYYELPGAVDMSYTRGDSMAHLRDMLSKRKNIVIQPVVSRTATITANANLNTNTNLNTNANIGASRNANVNINTNLNKKATIRGISNVQIGKQTTGGTKQTKPKPSVTNKPNIGISSITSPTTKKKPEISPISIRSQPDMVKTQKKPEVSPVPTYIPQGIVKPRKNPITTYVPPTEPRTPPKIPIIPVIPLGFPLGGSPSGADIGGRGAYSFKEVSPTWTAGEMGRSLFTGSFRPATVPRKPRIKKTKYKGR